MKTDLAIIGGGPDGLAAAVAAYDAGLRDILILERENALGGILKQCVHAGFGLHRFGVELAGPEYAKRYIDMVEERGIKFMLNTMVTGLECADSKADGESVKIVTAVNEEQGIFKLEAKSVVLAMGCRERPAGALSIAGSRPAGIYTAGTAQKYVNMMGYMPGKEVVILGSGDIGLIMARRMTLEGAKVKLVCEIMDVPSGLPRNIEQCLNDFGIPLKLSHTVVKIHGGKRLTGVTVAAVDEKRRPIPGTEEYWPCDTLLLSCGLIPENELTRMAGIAMSPVTNGAVVDASRETSEKGVFACGNVLHVHDLVDYVSEEAEIAGKAAADYVAGKTVRDCNISIKTDGKVRYTVPQRASQLADTKLFYRVGAVFENMVLTVSAGEKVLCTKKYRKLVPARMETLTIKKSLLEEAAAMGVDTLSIKLEPAATGAGK